MQSNNSVLHQNLPQSRSQKSLHINTEETYLFFSIQNPIHQPITVPPRNHLLILILLCTLEIKLQLLGLPYFNNKMNKLQMTKTELEKIKKQIRSELNKIKFIRKCQSPTLPQLSPSHRKHFNRTYTNMFKNVFDPEENETILTHQLKEKRHYRELSRTPSPIYNRSEKRHFDAQFPGHCMTPKSTRMPIMSIRREMKQRSRTRSQGIVSTRMLDGSKQCKDLSCRDVVLKSAAIRSKNCR